MRRMTQQAQARAGSRKVLCLTLSMGGGTKFFLEDYLQREYANAAEIWLLRPLPAHAYVTKSLMLYDARQPEHCVELPLDFGRLRRGLDELGVTEIFVNHLFGFPQEAVADFLLQSGRPYTLFLHDYYLLCPHFNLSCQARDCARAAATPHCQQAFAEAGLADWSLARYRQVMHRILQGAAQVLAPTSYAAGIVRAVYPDIDITVRPHQLTIPLAHTFQPAFAQAEPLTIAMLGVMWEPKGESWFRYLRDVVAAEKLPVRLVAIGENRKREPGICYTGRYRREKVSQVLAQAQTAVVLCPSTFPETYCYTASEAMLSGYPVLSMNLGAQAVRILQHDAGWVLPQDTRAQGEAALRAWVEHLITHEGRQEILIKAAHTQRFVNGME